MIFYRKGGADLPSNFEEKVLFEEKWMTAAMAGKTDEVPKRVTILRRGSLFGEPYRTPCIQLQGWKKTWPHLFLMYVQHMMFKGNAALQIFAFQRSD